MRFFMIDSSNCRPLFYLFLIFEYSLENLFLSIIINIFIMNLRSLLIVLIITLISQSKTIKKQIDLSLFPSEGPFIFLTKFYLTTNVNQYDIQYRKSGQVLSQDFYSDLSIGMVNQTMFQRFRLEKDCQKKVDLLYKRQKMYFREERHGMKHVKLFDLKQEQIWYFYFFSCLGHHSQIPSITDKIDLEFSILDNKNHYGPYQYQLIAYIIVIVIWICLIIKFASPLALILNLNRPDWLKLSIFGGFILLGAAYLYKLFHVVFIYYDGYGIPAFEIIYLLLKLTGQALIITMIISLAWGWTITNLNSNIKYLILGITICIINITGLVFCQLTQQREEVYHYYDTVPGTIILMLRILLFLWFILGINRSLSECSSKIRLFIKKLSWIGTCYLLSWPATVLLVQLTLPVHLHKDIINFVEESVHIISCTFLCHMISHPESAYRKISLHEDDNPLGMDSYRNK